MRLFVEINGHKTKPEMKILTNAWVRVERSKKKNRENDAIFRIEIDDCNLRIPKDKKNEKKNRCIK